MSDEVRDRESGDRESGVAAATVNENQEEQITKPAPKVKQQKEKDPKKVAAGKKLAEKNRQAKAALEREIKREIAEKEKENENSAGWLPEMSFQTVLSLVGVAFTAFELYQRFRPKVSSGSAQSPISPREEPKQSVAPSSEAPSKTLKNVEERGPEQRADEQSAVSSKIGMV